MRIYKGFHLTLLLACAGAVWGCDRSPQGWTPVLERTSTVFLETETDRISERVKTALDHLRSDPGQAEEPLREAKATVEHLQGYYLPLYRVRERAYNAYRYLYLGDETQVVEELGKVQESLEKMAGNVEGGALLELLSLSESVADARIAALADPEKAAPILESLARRLDLALLKGDLIINP